MALLAGCGGQTTTKGTTFAPQGRAPALASRPAAAGEILVRGEATPKSAGPFSFSGRYRVRFVQYAPEDPRHDFAAETPLVVDLERQEGVPAKHLFKAAAARGEKLVTIRGRFYVDASFGDYPFAVRFTKVRG